MNFVVVFRSHSCLKKINIYSIQRGWTAWLVASVDPRVVATVPVVMDLLNFKENIMHQFKAYGGWSFALEPYWELNLTYYFDHPKFDDLASIMDPFEHRDKLIMPKLVVNCANDEFFNLDNTRYWWDDMPMAYEMNRFLMLPNADHPVVGKILFTHFTQKMFINF